MAFCAFCGKQLGDNGVCDCEGSRAKRAAVQAAAGLSAAEAAAPPQTGAEAPRMAAYPPPNPEIPPTPAYPPPPNPEMYAPPAGAYPAYAPPPSRPAGAAGQLLASGLGTVKAFMKSPSDAMREDGEAGRFAPALIFFGIKALLMGLLTPAVIAVSMKKILNPFGFGSYYRMGAGGFFSIFFKMFFFSLAADAVFFGVAFLVGALLFKGASTVKGLVSALGAASLPFTAGFVVSCVLAFMSLRLGLFAFAATLCYCVVVNLTALRVSLRLEKDKMMYTQIIVLVALVIVIYIAGDIAASSAVGAVSSLFGGLLY